MRKTRTALIGLVLAALSSCGTGHVSTGSSASASGEASSPDQSLSTDAPSDDASSVGTTSPAASTVAAPTMPAEGDPAYPTSIYPPAATPIDGKSWQLTGGCPDVATLDRFNGDDKTVFAIAAYADAIRGVGSPYARADRALWPAIAGTSANSSSPLATVDLADYSVDWGKGSPDGRDIDASCVGNVEGASTFVTVGVSAKPSDRGYAYFVWRHGRPLLWAVRNLPVVGPWPAAAAAPGRVIDTSGFHLRPTVILSAAQLKSVLQGQSAGEWHAVVAGDRVFVARGSGPDHEADGAGALTAVDRATGAVLWRATIPACDAPLAVSGQRIWVWPACNTKAGYTTPQVVEELDAGSGRRLQRYVVPGVSALVPVGDDAWMLPNGNDVVDVVRLHAGVQTLVATVRGEFLGNASLPVIGNEFMVTVFANDTNTYRLTRVALDSGAVLGSVPLPADFGSWVTDDQTLLASRQSDDQSGGVAPVNPTTGVAGPPVAAYTACMVGTATVLWCTYAAPQRGAPSYVIAFSMDGSILAGGSLPQWTRDYAMDGEALVVTDGEQLVEYRR
jgi:hypothetical protein